MENSIDNFRKKIENIIDEAENLELKDYTFDLLDCIYIDICYPEDQLFNKFTLEGYVEELKNSIEIFNPEYTLDIEIMEKLLKEMEPFLEFNF